MCGRLTTLYAISSIMHGTVYSFPYMTHVRKVLLFPKDIKKSIPHVYITMTLIFFSCVIRISVYVPSTGCNRERFNVLIHVSICNILQYRYIVRILIHYISRTCNVQHIVCMHDVVIPLTFPDKFTLNLVTYT